MNEILNFLFTFFLFELIFCYHSNQIVENKIKNNNSILSFLQESLTMSFPVVPNNNGTMCLELCISSPKYCRLFAIHGQSFYIWLQDEKNDDESIEYKKKYNPNKSKSCQVNRTLIQIEYEEKNTITAYTITDNIYNKDKLLMRGEFLSATESKSFKGDEGMIGLGYRGTSKEEKFSFINQLYDNELIFHRVFTQNFDSGEQGVISFGEIPKNIVNDYEHYGRCPALDKILEGKKVKNRKWECEINGIYFGKDYNETKVKKYENTRVSFFSFRQNALVPKEVFEYFEKNYFESYIKNNVCKKFKNGDYDIFGCNKVIEDAPNINLLYGDWVMSLPSNKLFVYKKTTELYEFMFYHKKDFETWSLGRPVVRLFHMVYDYQNQEVGFYNKQNVIFINKDSKPTKPKIYEKLPESNDGINDMEEIDDDEDEAPRRRARKQGNEILDDIKKRSGFTNETKSKTMRDGIAIQRYFYGFLILFAILLLGFIGYIYYKHTQKPQNLSSEYFVKKANELSTKV